MRIEYKLLKATALALLLAPLATACKTQGDIDKAVKAARDEDSAACNEKMADLQKATDGKLSGKDKRIANLESEVQRLGGDITKVKSELGTELASTSAQLEATQKERDQLKAQREQAEKEAAEFREKLKKVVDSGALQVVIRKGRMTLNLPDNILFPSGSKTLKKEGKEALIQVAEVLKNVKDREFIIAGHTDSDPVKKGGAFKSNWELSTARAVEVVNLMVENGVAPEHLSAAGFGEFDPIGDNGSPEGKKKNRRLEIILMPRIQDLGQLSSAS